MNLFYSRPNYKGNKRLFFKEAAVYIIFIDVIAFMNFSQTEKEENHEQIFNS